MKLLKLKLHNFKGIRSFEFAPDGRSVDIYGANETGKTTIFDAVTWLLTDKDSRDRSPDNFGIKTRKDGQKQHGLDHSVEGVFDDVVLKKVYTEKWTRKRGASKEVFSGNTTDHFIDGVPVQAGEYKERVEDMMGEQLLKMLTMPDYFPEQMYWTDRREVLFSLVGDIDTGQIIAGADGLARYPEILGDRTHEAQEKVLKARKKELNDQLDNIPSRIDENNAKLYEVDGVEDAKSKVAELREKKSKIEAKRSEVDSGGAVATLKVEKQELEAKKQGLKNAHQKQIEQSLEGARAKVSDLQDKVDQAESEYRQAKRNYDTSQALTGDLADTVKALKEEIRQIEAREPKAASAFEPEKCPVCERVMPDAEEHDYEEYLDEFNARKAEELKAARQKLSRAEAEADEKLAETESLEQQAQNLYGKLNQRKQALEKAQKELTEQKAGQAGVEETDDWEQLAKDIEAIDERIADHRTEKQAQLEGLDQHIASLEEEISEAEATIHKADENQRTLKRIAELKEQQRDVAEQLEQVEEDLHVMEEFVRARSAYVTDRVNEKFEHVSWKLFEEQINGGITETCTAVYKGVPYDEGLNNAGRIQAGIDIINTLSRHYGKSAPIFVDNAESVTELPETDLQVIRLIVSPEHTKLTVEKAKSAQPVTA